MIILQTVLQLDNDIVDKEHQMISNDDDDDQVDFNESNLDFSILSEINDTKIQCKDEYNKLVVQILNRIVLKYSKSLKIN